MSDRVGHLPQTLAIDIGGTGLKASVLDHSGKMVDKHVGYIGGYTKKCSLEKARDFK